MISASTLRHWRPGISLPEFCELLNDEEKEFFSKMAADLLEEAFREVEPLSELKQLPKEEV